MGFVLWMERETAWAAGAHEYRPIGAAVIAATDLFSPRDFSPARRPPSRSAESFCGLFASLGELNAYLAGSRSRRKRNRRAAIPRRLISVI